MELVDLNGPNIPGTLSQNPYLEGLDLIKSAGSARSASFRYPPKNHFGKRASPHWLPLLPGHSTLVTHLYLATPHWSPTSTWPLHIGHPPLPPSTWSLHIGQHPLPGHSTLVTHLYLVTPHWSPPSTWPLHMYEALHQCQLDMDKLNMKSKKFHHRHTLHIVACQGSGVSGKNTS